MRRPNHTGDTGKGKVKGHTGYKTKIKVEI